MLSPPIPVTRIVHTIHATVDIDACRLLYQDALGGLVFAEGYFPPEDRDMALLYVANHMIEPMAPRNPADMSMPFARLSNKIGQCYHSFELKVEDGKSSSQALREAGCKVASDYGVFFFVRPESTGGILLEVCETPMPNDPYDRKGWNAKSGNGHASSVLRINHIACVVADLEKALHFFCSLIAGEIISDERVLLPQQGRKVMTQIGDTKVCFLQPDDPDEGPLGAFLGSVQNGIYALVWEIANESAARAHFSGLKLRQTQFACVSEGFAIEPADFMGARHEFVSR